MLQDKKKQEETEYETDELTVEYCWQSDGNIISTFIKTLPNFNWPPPTLFLLSNQYNKEIDNLQILTKFNLLL